MFKFRVNLPNEYANAYGFTIHACLYIKTNVENNFLIIFRFQVKKIKDESTHLINTCIDCTRDLTELKK